ncbi:MAG: sigma-54 dependent transcriptional regulator [Parvibaculum sp.]|jgi:DNA-binding NtrC family response regulator|uniref:sigma-54-dependent transcriptional regulator n=1 Tax=Parvibaculum sp. TaxID=2024848 RepID=UPI002850E6D7|nr:sigma-54 dependent transcriptional regulator [Parvibaculum sp.]MDR3499621.1 sigma-54 dependent transcriptional regulator [Parvibaculum sp.]
MTQSILIVDDDPAQRRILEEVVNRDGYRAVSVDGGEAALARLEGPAGAEISLVILDLVMPGVDGMEVLKRLQPTRPNLPVIVLTAHGGIETVVNVMREGATDFVIKPVSPERLHVSMRNALKVNALTGEISRLQKKQSGHLTFSDLIARSPGMEQVIRLGKRAAQSNIPILIDGESGVGKEMIASAIQGESDRAGKPFVTVNCGAIPENLVESILFGHEKGAFTGASDKHAGKFQEASGGTLFLDEIGELPLDMQVKLLRALQQGEVDPVGSKKPVKVDIRLISATNRDLLQMVKEGRFREDLYYRLNVFPIHVPPLRSRREDIPELVAHFIRRLAAEEGKPVVGISRDALSMLCAFDWPGNVRQVENTVFRAIVLCDGDMLDVSDFPQIASLVEGYAGAAMPTAAAAPRQMAPAPFPAERYEAPAREQRNTLAEFARSNFSDGIAVTDAAGNVRKLEDIEAEMIRLAIEKYKGHMTEVARRLGIGRSTLYRKVRDLGLEVREE